jgi:hypothetical protein
MGMGIKVVVRDAGSREKAVVHHVAHWCACGVRVRPEL